MRLKLAVCLVGILVFPLLGKTFVIAGDLDRFLGVKGTLRLAGGTAHIPVMRQAAKRIMGVNRDIRITIAGGGSGVGIKQVGEGLVHIGNTGRKATDNEINRYALKMFKFAIDGIAVVINPENPVVRMKKSEIMDIFSGKVDNWKALGWKDRGINIYTRDASSGTRKVFWKKALGKGNITKAANFVKSHGAMKSSISVDPYGVGYISVGYLDDTVAPVSLDGIPPTLENVRNGDYKIARGLYMNTKGEPGGLTRLFIDYILSKEGQEIVAEKGFIRVR